MHNITSTLSTAFFITVICLSPPLMVANSYSSNFMASPSIQSQVKQNIDPPITEIPVPQNNSEPLAISVDSKGNVWFAGSFGHQLVEYTPSSGAFRNFSVPTPSHVGLIWFILFDNSGNIWFSDASQPLLWRFSPSTSQFANFSTGSQSVDPYALAYNPSTNMIWFTSIYTGQIGVFQISPNESASLLKMVNVPDPELSYQTSPSSPIIGPSGITIDSAGNLFISESFASAIAEYNPNASAFTRIWKLPGGSSPVGVAVDASRGRIWFTNHATSDIGYVDESNNRVTEFSTSLFSYSTQGGSDTITLPYWISVSHSGMIWFDEHYGNKIARFNPNTLQLTEFLVPTAASSPLRFVLDNNTGLVWFTEFSGNKIGVLAQNDSINSIVSLSPNSIALSANTFSVIANYDIANSSSINVFSPLVSGTPSFDGHLDSNFTLSFQSLNSTAYKISFNRGQQLSSGNYTLTICPRLSSNDSESSAPPVRQCSIVFLGIDNNVSPGDQIELYIIAVIVLVAIISISLFFVRRWKST